MMYHFKSISVQYHPDLQLLRWQWLYSMSESSFMVDLEQLVKLARSLRPRRWLADISVLPPVSTTVQQWLSELWLPAYRRVSGYELAVLLPTSMHNQLALENLIADACPSAHCEIQYFSDIPAALDWLTVVNNDLALTLQDEWLQGISEAPNRHLALDKPNGSALLPPAW